MQFGGMFNPGFIFQPPVDYGYMNAIQAQPYSNFAQQQFLANQAQQQAYAGNIAQMQQNIANTAAGMQGAANQLSGAVLGHRGRGGGGGVTPSAPTVGTPTPDAPSASDTVSGGFDALTAPPAGPQSPAFQSTTELNNAISNPITAPIGVEASGSGGVSTGGGIGGSFNVPPPISAIAGGGGGFSPGGTGSFGADVTPIQPHPVTSSPVGPLAGQGMGGINFAGGGSGGVSPGGGVSSLQTLVQPPYLYGAGGAGGVSAGGGIGGRFDLGGRGGGDTTPITPHSVTTTPVPPAVTPPDIAGEHGAVAPPVGINSPALNSTFEAQIAARRGGFNAGVPETFGGRFGGFAPGGGLTAGGLLGTPAAQGEGIGGYPASTPSPPATFDERFGGMAPGGGLSPMQLLRRGGQGLTGSTPSSSNQAPGGGIQTVPGPAGYYRPGTRPATGAPGTPFGGYGFGTGPAGDRGGTAIGAGRRR